MIFRMIEYPEVMQKVRQEIQAEIGHEEITFEGLKKLKYLDCVQKEVLRRDCPAFELFYRIAKSDHFLGSLKIPQGLYVSVLTSAVQLRSE